MSCQKNSSAYIVVYIYIAFFYYLVHKQKVFIIIYSNDLTSFSVENLKYNGKWIMKKVFCLKVLFLKYCQWSNKYNRYIHKLHTNIIYRIKFITILLLGNVFKYVRMTALNIPKLHIIFVITSRDIQIDCQLTKLIYILYNIHLNFNAILESSNSKPFTFNPGHFRSNAFKIYSRILQSSLHLITSIFIHNNAISFYNYTLHVKWIKLIRWISTGSINSLFLVPYMERNFLLEVWILKLTANQY